MTFAVKWTTAALASLVVAALLFASSAPSAYAGALAREHFPNIVLTTQDGKKVRFYDDLIKNKIFALNFIYTKCHFSCPLETARLVKVQQVLGNRVGKDIFFYSISIDPKRDTPAELRAYAKKFHVSPGWTFLTGKRKDIDLLALKLGLTDDPSITSGPGGTVDGHTAHLLIGDDKTGQLLRDSSTDNPRFLAFMISDFMDPGHNQFAASRHGTGARLHFNDIGQYLFVKDCAACHTIGQGDKIGPDLKGVTRLRAHDWLVRYISEPDRMLTAGDPIAKALNAKYKVAMPDLRLGPSDVTALLNFLSARDADEQQASPANHLASSMGATTGK